MPFDTHRRKRVKRAPDLKSGFRYSLGYVTPQPAVLVSTDVSPACLGSYLVKFISFVLLVLKSFRGDGSIKYTLHYITLLLWGDETNFCNIFLVLFIDWKKTSFHKAQQAKLLNLLFTFGNKKQGGN